VDNKAFPQPQFVKVSLLVLGYEPGACGTLQEISGCIESRYYDPHDGLPMFTVDFNGSIGIHRVRVVDMVLDYKRMYQATETCARTLNFGDVDNVHGASSSHAQGCHTGRPEAFWRANQAGGRAGGPVHYALYEPGGVL
jgi:hypothetical protein